MDRYGDLRKTGMEARKLLQEGFAAQGVNIPIEKLHLMAIRLKFKNVPKKASEYSLDAFFQQYSPRDNWAHLFLAEEIERTMFLGKENKGKVKKLTEKAMVNAYKVDDAWGADVATVRRKVLEEWTMNEGPFKWDRLNESLVGTVHSFVKPLGGNGNDVKVSKTETYSAVHPVGGAKPDPLKPLGYEDIEIPDNYQQPLLPGQTYTSRLLSEYQEIIVQDKTNTKAAQQLTTMLSEARIRLDALSENTESKEYTETQQRIEDLKFRLENKRKQRTYNQSQLQIRKNKMYGLILWSALKDTGLDFIKQTAGSFKEIFQLAQALYKQVSISASRMYDVGAEKLENLQGTMRELNTKSKALYRALRNVTVEGLNKRFSKDGVPEVPSALELMNREFDLAIDSTPRTDLSEMGKLPKAANTVVANDNSDPRPSNDNEVYSNDNRAVADVKDKFQIKPGATMVDNDNFKPAANLNQKHSFIASDTIADQLYSRINKMSPLEIATRTMNLMEDDTRIRQVEENELLMQDNKEQAWLDANQSPKMARFKPNLMTRTHMDELEDELMQVHYEVRAAKKAYAKIKGDNPDVDRRKNMPVVSMEDSRRNMQLATLADQIEAKRNRMFEIEDALSTRMAGKTTIRGYLPPADLQATGFRPSNRDKVILQDMRDALREDIRAKLGKKVSAQLVHEISTRAVNHMRWDARFRDVELYSELQNADGVQKRVESLGDYVERTVERMRIQSEADIDGKDFKDIRVVQDGKNFKYKREPQHLTKFYRQNLPDYVLVAEGDDKQVYLRADIDRATKFKNINDAMALLPQLPEGEVLEAAVMDWGKVRAEAPGSGDGEGLKDVRAEQPIAEGKLNMNVDGPIAEFYPPVPVGVPEDTVRTFDPYLPSTEVVASTGGDVPTSGGRVGKVLAGLAAVGGAAAALSGSEKESKEVLPRGRTLTMEELANARYGGSAEKREQDSLDSLPGAYTKYAEARLELRKAGVLDTLRKY